MNQAKFDIFMRKLRGNGEQIWKWRKREKMSREKMRKGRERK